jgi:3-hydroxyacyl-[acyl-carrier-protein] dehydratase
MSILRDAIIASAKGPAREKEPGVFVRRYSFAPDFVGFSGHFPGYPVLPAFVQMLTLMTMAEEVKDRSLRPISVEKGKFRKEIYPDVEVEVEYREVVIKGKRALKASLTTGEGAAASLLVTFEEENET